MQKKSLLKHIKHANIFFLYFAGRLSAIFIGVLTLVIGIILSSIPWVDYIILKVCTIKTNNSSFSYHLLLFFYLLPNFSI